MDKDINDRNYNNYEEVGGKPTKRVIGLDTSGNLVNPATSNNQTNGLQKTQIVETIPNDSNHLNGSLSGTESTLGTITTTTLTKTVGVTVLTKTITMDSSDNSFTISSWS